MNSFKFLSLTFCLLFFFLFINTIQAQYVIHQIEYNIPITAKMFPENKKFESNAGEAKYFLNLPEDKLKHDKNENKVSKSTIYLDGENFAVDNISPQGEKSSTITNSKKGMFYLVMWPRKTVMEMSTKDMEQMQKAAEVAGEKMTKKLSPELQKQMKEEEANKNSSSEPEVKYTGKDKNINGFECKQYLVEHGDNVMMIWATDDNKDLSQHVESATKKIKSLFPSSGEEEKDEWEALPGKIPVVVKTFNSDMNGSHIVVQEITKISKEKPPAEKFIPPGKAQGFTTRSMKDMIMQMKGMMNKGDKSK
jgi:hypothetical protein